MESAALGSRMRRTRNRTAGPMWRDPAPRALLVGGARGGLHGPIPGRRVSLKLGSGAAENVDMGTTPLQRRNPGSRMKKVGA